MTSLLTSPQQGPDAAAVGGPDVLPTAACTDAERSTAQVGSHAVSAGVSRDGGSGAELTPAVSAHHGLCMAVHVHSTRDERLACEMEHEAVMARLLLAGEVA